MRRTLQIVPGPGSKIFFFFYPAQSKTFGNWSEIHLEEKRGFPLKNYKNVRRGVYPPCLCVRKQADKVPYKDSVMASQLF